MFTSVESPLKDAGVTILQVGNANIADSNFTNNQAAAGSGGCLYVTSSAVSIDESVFYNYRASYGSCSYAVLSSITISGSVFCHNIQGSFLYICIASSTITINDSEFRNNRALSGGAIYAQSSTN